MAKCSQSHAKNATSLYNQPLFLFPNQVGIDIITVSYLSQFGFIIHCFWSSALLVRLEGVKYNQIWCWRPLLAPRNAFSEHWKPKLTGVWKKQVFAQCEVGKDVPLPSSPEWSPPPCCTVHCALYSVQCSVYCVVWSVQFAVCSVYCVLCTV